MLSRGRDLLHASCAEIHQQHNIIKAAQISETTKQPRICCYTEKPTWERQGRDKRKLVTLGILSTRRRVPVHHTKQSVTSYDNFGDILKWINTFGNVTTQTS